MEAAPLFAIDFLSILKVFALIGFGLYIIFALVVVRQVQLMTSTLEVGLEWLVKLISLGHLLFAIFVFFLAAIAL